MRTSPASSARGNLYALDVMPGETVELVFTCGRSPQTWLMTSAFASGHSASAP